MASLQQNIDFVVAEFAKIDRMDPCGKAYDKLCALLDRCDDDALRAVYKANAKFVSKLAFNRMIRRGIV